MTITITPVAARTSLLTSAGFNTFNLPSVAVALDLQTDSWPELAWPAIAVRMHNLRAQATPVCLEDAAKSIFPYEYFMPMVQGRLAEFFLCNAMIHAGGVVPQNLLFPTTRYHQILKRASPQEIPVDDVMDQASTNFFKGNLDNNKLETVLSTNEARKIPFINVELANNAAGGYAVALQNLQESYQLAQKYGVPLILDTTRILENAAHIQQYELTDQSTSLFDIVQACCRHSDGMTLSLCKDFCLDKGGLIATNDRKLFSRLKDAKLTYGNGLNLSDRNQIGHALADWEFIESCSRQRVMHVKRLHACLTQAGIPLLTPAPTHCLVLDVANFPAFQSSKYPVQSFLAWLFLKTGIRGGLHNSGMDRRFARPNWVRFAIPLGLTNADIDAIENHLLTSLGNINEPLVLQRKATPIMGLSDGLTAHYQIIG